MDVLYQGKKFVDLPKLMLHQKMLVCLLQNGADRIRIAFYFLCDPEDLVTFLESVESHFDPKRLVSAFEEAARIDGKFLGEIAGNLCPK